MHTNNRLHDVEVRKDDIERNAIELANRTSLQIRADHGGLERDGELVEFDYSPAYLLGLDAAKFLDDSVEKTQSPVMSCSQPPQLQIMAVAGPRNQPSKLFSHNEVFSGS